MASSIYSYEYYSYPHPQLLESNGARFSCSKPLTEWVVCGILDRSLYDARLDSEPHEIGGGDGCSGISQSEH